MTQHDENCPTCGSQLSALHRVELRRCNACRRNTPAGFLYCGYCASPMEHDEIRPRVAEVAAPPGGWPNLVGDLTEVKFFLKQGQLDEAYDLLSILQRRYPGHPELADFARSAEASPRPDADVEQLVDTVLAESSTLGGKIPRRRATPWDAPESESTQRGGRKLTTAHEVVRAALIDDVDIDAEEAEEASDPVAKVVVAEYAKNPRPARKPVPKLEHTHTFKAIPPKQMPQVRLRAPKNEVPTPKAPDAAKARDTAAKVRAAAAKVKAIAEQRPPLPKPNDAKNGHPATLAAPPPKKSGAEPQHTMVVDALQPAAPYPDRPNQTMAVDALQPAAPFDGESDELFEARKEQIKRATNKTGRRRRVATGANKTEKRKRPRGVPPKREEPNEESKKRRGTAFGAGVLSRFGR